MNRTTPPLKGPGSRSKTPQGFSEISIPATSIHKVEAGGVRVFYRAAGDPNSPIVLLLHGFPTSSFMFRELIPRLATDYRLIAPDLPGFGFTEVPAERKYIYSFDRLAATLNAFTQVLKIKRFCTLCVRLWRTYRISSGDGSSRSSHGDRFTERERL